jgi:hypothetical protein
VRKFNAFVQINPLLVYTGIGFAVLSILLILFIPFNEIEVLGINSLIKPLKFSLSIWLYCWTMALLLSFFVDKSLVRRIAIIAVIVMVFEQLVITAQAFRGELSHFNETDTLGIVLFSLMGLMITWNTLEVLRGALKFRKQIDEIDPALKAGIYWGLMIFVVGSFIGGYMGYLRSHQIGGPMGEAGLALVNWSVNYGDVRVSHFIGLHALQLIPLFAYLASKKIQDQKKSKQLVLAFSLIYILVVVITLLQAILGKPLISLG